jgi:hypothetical protein
MADDNDDATVEALRLAIEKALRNDPLHTVEVGVFGPNASRSEAHAYLARAEVNGPRRVEAPRLSAAEFGATQISALRALAALVRVLIEE